MKKFVFPALAVAIIAAACGSGSSGAATAMTVAAPKGAHFYTVSLQPVAPFHVTGTAKVAYVMSKREFYVKLDLKGLVPNSRHVMHIHKGLMSACSPKSMRTMAMGMSMGPILIPLGVHKANSAGVIDTSFLIKSVAPPPFGHIHLMVHAGPTIKTEAGARPVACANITGAMS
jgi:hypothetical protein